MPVVSITRLRVRSWRQLPSFAWHTWRSQRQARRTPGCMQGSVGNAAGLAFWTATMWSDEAAMKGFRNTGAHQRAMPRLLDMCDEASVARWTQDTDRLPSPAEMVERMRAEGRISKVRRPSEPHRRGDTVPGAAAPRMGGPFRGRAIIDARSAP
jgi:hypothetical protein